MKQFFLQIKKFQELQSQSYVTVKNNSLAEVAFK